MKNFVKKTYKPLILLIVAGFVVVYYFYLSNRNVDNTEKISRDTPVTQITERDLTLNYPGTPRSVVSFYSEILKVIYSYDLSDEEIQQIARKLHGIFDDELISYNPFNKYVIDLKAEIEEFKTAGRTVADYVVENSNNIEFLTYEKHEYAKVDVTYFQHVGKNIVKTYEKFTLRKDDNGRWKILFWEEGKASDNEN